MPSIAYGSHSSNPKIIAFHRSWVICGWLFHCKFLSFLWNVLGWWFGGSPVIKATKSKFDGGRVPLYTLSQNNWSFSCKVPLCYWALAMLCKKAWKLNMIWHVYFFGGGWPKTKVVTETALRRVVGRLLKYIWYIYIHLFIYIDIIYLKPQNQSNSSVWWNTVWTHYVKTLSKPHWAFCPIWL